MLERRAASHLVCAILAASASLSLSSSVCSPAAGAKSATTETVEQTRAKGLCAEGQALFDGLQYDAAIAKYQEALTVDSSCDLARIGLAQCFYGQKRFYAAIEQLEVAVKNLPGNDKAWLLYARSLQNVDEMDKSMDAYRSYIALVKDPDEKSKYENLIAALQAQKANTKKPQLQPSDKNYLAEVTANGVYRWPSNKLIIPVYIEPPDKVPGYKPHYDESLRKALHEWSVATDKKVQFVIVKEPPDSGITVSWTDNLHAPELTAEAGLTTSQSNSEGITSAKIQLLTVSPFKDEPFTEWTLYNICLHELGHALGMNGHSPNEEDMMYPASKFQSGLSAADRNTFALLYSDNFDDASAKAAASAYPHRAQTTAEKGQRLLQEGTRFCMAGDYMQAIEKLKAALKIDPTNAVAKKNLSVSANNLAIKAEQANDEKLAKSYFHQALYFDSTGDSTRTNLNNLLRSEGHDPASVIERGKLGDKYATQGDLCGAVVEYQEALRIKSDVAIEKKLADVLKRYQDAEQLKI